MGSKHFETEAINKLYLELSQFATAKTRGGLELEELLLAVESKFPGETRFDTALRYIREAEKGNSVAASSGSPE